MDENKENKDKKEDNEDVVPKLASERTDLAVLRTILANSRTFSAWIRTGLSSVLAGLAIVRFIGDNEYFRGYVVFIGMLFVLIGIAVYVLAFIDFKRSYDKLKDEVEDTTRSLGILIAITTGMILTAILIMGLLIFYQ